MKRCGFLMAIAVLAAVWLSGCSSGDGSDLVAGGEFEEQESEEQEDAGSQEADSETTVVAAPPAGDYQPPDGWIVARTVPLDGVTVSDDGTVVEVFFIGGPEGDPADPCSRNYDFAVDENAGSAEINAALYELSGENIGPVPDDYVCLSAGHSWQLDHNLQAPLGDRVLVDASTDAPVVVTELATVLKPNYVPDGWETGQTVLDGGTISYWYRKPGVPDFATVDSTTIDGLWGLDDIRNRQLVEVVETTVRGRPAIEVTSLEDGAVTLAWEESGRVYQVHGYRMDVSEMVAIADSMS